MSQVSVNERDLREFIEAAEEVRDEATHAAAFSPTAVAFSPTAVRTFNALDRETEHRFQLALDALKFALAERAA